MKKIGIIGAMTEEINLIKDNLVDEDMQQISNLTFYLGTFNNVEVVLVQSGIGKVNAAISATLLIERFRCEAIINTGSAGAINHQLSIGDVVIANQLAYHDADSRAFGYDYGQIPQMPKYYPCDKKLAKLCRAAAEESRLHVKIGEIVSGDSFVATDERKADILSYFPQAMVTEMEGTAIAQVAYQFDIPVAVIRSVSDTADGEANQSFDDFIVEAGARSAGMVLLTLAKL